MLGLLDFCASGDHALRPSSASSDREGGMGLFDRDSEEPKSKLRRYLITALALLLLLAAAVWYALRFHTEKKTVATFFEALVRGDTAAAYRMWSKLGTYTYQEFLNDWTAGYYGPVRSYRIVTAQQKSGASGVVVVVEISPDSPFPQPGEADRLLRTKEVKIWVERKDQSLSFAP